MAALMSSPLSKDGDNWRSSPDHTVADLKFPPLVFDSVTQHLLCNPNLNSTHLFRADILFDSLGELKTPTQIEQDFEVQHPSRENSLSELSIFHLSQTTPKEFPGLKHQRTVIRALIPRKPQLDKSTDQICHFYTGRRLQNSEEADGQSLNEETHLLIQIPNVSLQDEVPWYHPPLKALAFLYEFSSSTAPGSEFGTGRLSVHILPFPGQVLDPLPERLRRTLVSLLSTYVRLARITPEFTDTSKSLRVSSRYPKDTLVPQHILQNTYTRLKSKYAPGLIEKWVEKTEPSKHVFEDIAIAAFLIELWRASYGVDPATQQQSYAEDKRSFPGFVDLACGNGVLVFILLSEGYHGWGFDLRRRKTWSIFPKCVQPRLMEMICVPKPFHDVLDLTSIGVDPENVHDGIFGEGTFFISNHADELTPWAPLLAALSSPESPLPFLAIPCCSHALSGARHRYATPKSKEATDQADGAAGQDDQPASGDLKALKMAKAKAAAGDQHSTYAALTAYVEHIAEEVGYVVEPTMMRIPSTRNIGLVGRSLRPGSSVSLEQIDAIVERECEKSGGVETAAKLWIERAVSLQRGPGRGKLKGGASH